MEPGSPRGDHDDAVQLRAATADDALCIGVLATRVLPIYLVAAIVASIPAGLGCMVLAPVLLLAAYVAYKDLFGGP